LIHLIDYAKSFLGIRYQWGGSSPLSGLDCSGLVQLILASAGMDPPGDQNAQSLYDHFSNHGSTGVYQAGSLAFYGKDAKHIIHVGFCIDPYRMIEAAGGDHTVVDLESAKKRNAYVKMSLIKRRSDLVALVRPFYVHIGLS
jgi:cell wall-associated NlpC family hydrolase